MKIVWTALLVMCSNSATEGKQMKQGLLGRGNNSKGLGITRIDLLGKYWRGFRIYVWE